MLSFEYDSPAVLGNNHNETKGKFVSKFISYDLNENILKTLNEINFTEPTPIQELAIPKICEGRDIIACAQTGTGKTAAFMLPILNYLIQNPAKKMGGAQVLVLVPTRELAMQVADEAKRFSKHLPHIKTACVYGGVPYPMQKRMLAKGYEILVATPGRLMDHMERGRINLSQVKILVLDEADRMLDMGFIEAIEHIATALPATRQTLLFSATIDKKILPFSKKLQTNPFEIKLESDHTVRDNIDQQLYYVDDRKHKLKVLDHLLGNMEMNQTIIFTSTINQTGELADYLQEGGYNTEALHGDMNQRQRTRTINRLRKGDIQILIATDVAARGIDISSITHVINFDLPFQSEDFIHRIGRTGRAGAKGTAITFATYREEKMVNRINELNGIPLKSFTIVGMEPKAVDRATIAAGQRRKRGRSGGSRPDSKRFNSSGYSNNDRNDSPRRDRNSSSSYSTQERGDYPRRDRGPSSSNYSSQERSEYPRRDRAPSSNYPTQERSEFPRRERGYSGERDNSFSQGEGRSSFSPRKKEGSFNSYEPRFSDSKPDFRNEGKPAFPPKRKERDFNSSEPRFSNPRPDFRSEGKPAFPPKRKERSFNNASEPRFSDSKTEFRKEGSFDSKPRSAKPFPRSRPNKSPKTFERSKPW